MTEGLVELLELFQVYFVPFVLVFLRIGAAIFVLPLFGEQMVPMRIRLAMTLLFCLITVPALLPLLNEQIAKGTPIPLMGLGEVITGLAIGISLRLQIMALQIAASIAAQSTSLAQLLGGASVDPQPAIGMFLYLAALALAAEFGLHVQFSMMFIQSYETVLAGQMVGAGFAMAISAAVAESFNFAFVLAAPFVAVSLLYNLALGVINRAMPQLMVAFVGAPAITYGALILLSLTATLILTIWAEQMQMRINAPFGSR